MGMCEYPKCNVVVPESIRFCSKKCARGYATYGKRSEINAKVSERLSGKAHPHVGVKRSLETVRKILSSRRNYYLEHAEAAKARHDRAVLNLCKPSAVAKRTAKLHERIANGSHIGWKARNIKSYAEKFFIGALKNNGLLDMCKQEHPVSKLSLGLKSKGFYFLDFFFTKKLIDLEIDGKQHRNPTRIVGDKIRDEVLTNAGYRVYRIPWCNVNSAEGKSLISSEIEKFLKFYDSIA